MSAPLEQRPCVVRELEVAHQMTRSGMPYTVIRNSGANRYLKVESREFDLLSLMDGTRTLPELVVEDFKMHHSLAPPRVAGLVRQLQENQFLTDPPTQLAGSSPQPKAQHGLARLARGFLYTELPFKNMDAHFGAWYRSWGWGFFTRPVVALLFIIAVLGPTLFGLELSRGRYSLVEPTASSLLSVLILLSMTVVALSIHELGHGLVVKHAGRFVIRSGCLIYYGFPAAFVDTTDIWMAPLRMRLLTSLAGPLTGFLVGGLCALGAFLLPQGAAGAFLFAWGFIFLVNNFLNFNPLLELDGYYLLVDLVEKPLLRARALSFVRGPLWQKLRRRERLSGEERFFSLFGLASALWSLIAVFLGLRFWELLLQRPLHDLWENGGYPAHAILSLLAALLSLPFLLTGFGWLRSLAGAFARRLAWLPMRWAEHHYRDALDLLRLSPMWASLPEAQLVAVARAMQVHSPLKGIEVVRQAQRVRRYYLVAGGELEVEVDGKPIKRLTRGDHFGLRALLEDAPGTASVIALKAGRLFSLERTALRTSLGDELKLLVQLEAALGYHAELEALPLFHEFSTTELRSLLDKLVPLSVPAGATIISAGLHDDRFFIVRSGKVQVAHVDGRPDILAAGEAFNIEALSQNVEVTASVQALEPTELLALHEADLNELLVEFHARAGEAERLSHLQVTTHQRMDQVIAGAGN